MTTVTDSALARFNASTQKRSSIKLSLVGKTVDCTRYTRRPRTLSLTRTNRFPSEKRSTSPVPGCTCKYSQILSVSLGLPLPPKMRISSVIVIPPAAPEHPQAQDSSVLQHSSAQTAWVRYGSTTSEVNP